MVNRYIWPNDRTIVNMLQRHKVLVIRGILGSGKTCRLKRFQQVSDKQGWATGTASVQDNSLVQVLRSLTAEINTPNFDKAFKEYLDEFKKVGKDRWIKVISSILPSILASSAQMSQIAGAPDIVTIAVTAGSTIITEEVIRAAVGMLYSQKDYEGWLRTESPLDRLCKAFERDLCSGSGDTRTILLIDGFEQLSSFLDSYLPSLIEVSQNATWVIAVWGAAPDFLENIDIINCEEWETSAFGASELQKIDPNLTSIHMSKLQGPPVFGLPILVREGLRDLQGKGTHRGVWYPLIDHLEQWLKFQFQGISNDILKHLRRCSVARYLDEGLVGLLTEDLDLDITLWDWLDKSPILERLNIAGVNRSVIDCRLRSILVHDLYRQNEKEYYDLHSKMQNYYEEFEPRRWHHCVEAWYHDWCVSSPEKSLKRALHEAVRLLIEQQYNYFRDIGQILRDIGIERVETLSLRRPGSSIIDAGEALLAEQPEPDWEEALFFYELAYREIFTSLDEESQAEIWFGIGKGRSKIDKYGEAKEAFEEILKIFPEDEDVQTELEQIEGMLMGEEQE